MPFIPSNHFWLADDARVYGSAKQIVSTTADPDYVAWTADGYVPTPWPGDTAGNQTEAELQTVVAPYGQFVNLIYYAASARYNRASSGVIITSLSPVPFLTDPVSRNTVNSAYDYMILKGTGTVQWKMSDGTFITVDKVKITTMMNDVAAFVQSCFACESTTVDSINGGTITTRAQVDAAFAAISNVFP